MRIKLKQRKSTVGDCFVVALGGMSPFPYFFHRDNIVQEWTWLEEERETRRVVVMVMVIVSLRWTFMETMARGKPIGIMRGSSKKRKGE